MQYTKELLYGIIESHQHYLNNDCPNCFSMRADLSDANLSEAERPRLGKILDEPLTGYKKSREGNIITATIPVGAVVFSINNSKCRTNKARIIDMEGAELLHSQHDSSFEYRLFQDIEIKDFDLMYNIECASGFHFFSRPERKRRSTRLGSIHLEYQ